MIIKEMPTYQVLVNQMAHYPEMDVQVTESNLHVLRTGTILQNRLERLLADLGMSYGRFVVLGLLSMESAPLPMCELADKAGVTSPTISVVVGGMVRDGLVERVLTPSDRRKVCIGLSPSGQAALKGVGQLFIKWQAKVMAGLSPEELRTLVALLSKINLKALPHDEQAADLLKKKRHITSRTRQPAPGSRVTQEPLDGDGHWSRRAFSLDRQHRYYGDFGGMVMQSTENNHSSPARAMLLAVLAVVSMLWGCGEGKQKAAPAPVPEVATVTVQPRQIDLTTELPGRTSPFLVAEIRPQVSGIVQKRLFRRRIRRQGRAVALPDRSLAVSGGPALGQGIHGQGPGQSAVGVGQSQALREIAGR